MSLMYNTPNTRASWTTIRQAICVASLSCIVLGTDLPCVGDETESDVLKNNVVFNIRIGIAFADNPIFTPLFKSGVARHVNGQLNAYFGPLADCKLLSPNDQHWLTEKMDLPKMSKLEIDPAWLPEESAAIPEKVALVYIDYVQSAYQVRLQVVDRETGWISPMRTQRIPDRQMVAQVICDLFIENFPISISIEKIATNDGTERAKYTLKGGDRMKRIQSKLENNPYFKVYRKHGEKPKRYPIEDTVLFLDPSHPNGTGRVISGAKMFCYPDATYEGISLPTQQGIVELQIVDPKTRRGATNCIVHMSDKEFGDSSGSSLGSPNRKGFVQTSPVFNNVVYISITQGGKRPKRFPVPLLERTVKLRREFDLDRGGAAGINLAQALRRINTVVNSLIRYQNTTRKEAERYYDEQMYEKALALAHELNDQYKDNAARVRSDFMDLGTLSTDVTTLQKSQIKNIKRFLSKQPERERSNQTLLESIEATITHNDNKTRAEAALVRGNHAKKDCGDYEEALDHYRKAKDLFQKAADTGVADDGDNYAAQLDNASQEIAELQESLRIKGEDHREAREFVTKTLKNSDFADCITDHLPKLKRNNYISTLQNVCDRSALERLQCICDECDEELNDFIEARRLADGDEVDAEEMEELETNDNLITEIRQMAKRAIIACQDTNDIEELDTSDDAHEENDTSHVPSSLPYLIARRPLSYKSGRLA